MVNGSPFFARLDTLHLSLLFLFCSGTAIMQDGNTMRNNYGCDLDTLTTGSRIGMMRTATGDLHYFINGLDQGVACTGLPPGNFHKNYFTFCNTDISELSNV